MLIMIHKNSGFIKKQTNKPASRMGVSGYHTKYSMNHYIYVCVVLYIYEMDIFSSKGKINSSMLLIGLVHLVNTGKLLKVWLFVFFVF